MCGWWMPRWLRPGKEILRVFRLVQKEDHRISATEPLPPASTVYLFQAKPERIENVGLELSFITKIGRSELRINRTFSVQNNLSWAGRHRYIRLFHGLWSSNNIEGRWSNARAATTCNGRRKPVPEFGRYLRRERSVSTRMPIERFGMYRLDDRDGDATSPMTRYYKWSQSNPPCSTAWPYREITRISISTLYSAECLHSKTLGLSSYAGFGYLYYLPKLYRRLLECRELWWWPMGSQWMEFGFWPALCRVNRAGPIMRPIRATTLQLINATYLRLKTVELGYTFKPALLNKIGVRARDCMWTVEPAHSATNFLNILTLKVTIMVVRAVTSSPRRRSVYVNLNF